MDSSKGFFSNARNSDHGTENQSASTMNKELKRLINLVMKYCSFALWRVCVMWIQCSIDISGLTLLHDYSRVSSHEILHHFILASTVFLSFQFRLRNIKMLFFLFIFFSPHPQPCLLHAPSPLLWKADQDTNTENMSQIKQYC